MKKVLLILSIVMMSTSISAIAQNTDLQSIEKTLNYYLNGLVEKDAEMLKKAFHPSATMKFIDKGDYLELNAIEALTAGIESSPKQKTTTRIVSINISGNAASAQLEIQLPDLTYIDFMNILKIEGEWKIVSKIFHTRLKDQ